MEKVALHQLKFKVLKCESKPFGYVQRPLLKTKLWTFELFCFKLCSGTFEPERNKCLEKNKP